MLKSRSQTIPLIFLFALLSACSKAGSTTAPTLPTPTLSSAQETPLTGSESDAPNDEIIPSPTTIDFDLEFSFLLTKINVSDPNNGWITYDAYLALHNRSSSSIYLLRENSGSGFYGGFSPLLEAINLYVGNTFVETSEGEKYPVEITFLMPAVIIPSELIVSMGTSSYLPGQNPLLEISYRVPELLHPTKIGINPGVSVNEGEPIPVNIDLTKAPIGHEFPSLEPSGGTLPSTVQANEQIQIEIKPVPGDQTDSSESEIVLSFEFDITNLDITADSQLNLVYFLIDQYGAIIENDCGDLPQFIGPGQTETRLICFRVPSNVTGASQEVYLSIISDSVDKTFSIQQ